MFYWWVLWVDEANINQIRWHTSSSNSQRCKYDFMFRILRGLRSFFLQNKHQAVFGTHQRLMLGMRRDVRMEWETNRKNSEVTKSSWFLRVPSHSVHVTPQLLSPSHGSYISCWKSFFTRDFYPFEKTESLGRSRPPVRSCEQKFVQLWTCRGFEKLGGPGPCGRSFRAQDFSGKRQKLDTKSWTQSLFLRRSTTSEYFCTSRSAFQTPNPSKPMFDWFEPSTRITFLFKEFQITLWATDPKNVCWECQHLRQLVAHETIHGYTLVLCHLCRIARVIQCIQRYIDITIPKTIQNLARLKLSKVPFFNNFLMHIEVWDPSHNPRWQFLHDSARRSSCVRWHHVSGIGVGWNGHWLSAVVHCRYFSGTSPGSPGSRKQQQTIAICSKCVARSRRNITVASREKHGWDNTIQYTSLHIYIYIYNNIIYSYNVFTYNSNICIIYICRSHISSGVPSLREFSVPRRALSSISGTGIGGLCAAWEFQ